MTNEELKCRHIRSYVMKTLVLCLLVASALGKQKPFFKFKYNCESQHYLLNEKTITNNYKNLRSFRRNFKKFMKILFRLHGLYSK